uniref:Phosphatidylinositol-glycan biosynthesis class X protein n=1 Tax=Steinernema glaseri TaxID=37863 RepID=A0A1I7ZI00_9BILA
MGQMYLVLLFSVFAVVASQQCAWLEAISNVDMSMKLGKSGFHRDLQVSLAIGSKSRFMECQLLYRFVIPAGGYIDMDSVNNSMRFHTVYPSVKFDVEAPAEASKNQAVLLYGHKVYRKVFLINDSFALPVHMRYHKAVENGEDAEVEFKAPEIFVRCSTDQEDYTKCAKGGFKWPCDVSDKKKKCEWVRIPKKKDVKAIGIMPRGNLNHLNVVAVVTFLFVFTAAAFIVAPLIPLDPKKQDKEESKKRE